MIQAFLEIVDVERGQAVGRHDIIHERDDAAAFADARHFRHRFARVEIVVQRDPIRHEVERVVIERERVRVGGSKFDIRNCARLRDFSRLVEHLRRQVGCDDARDMRREGQRGVPRACRNVEHVPSALRLRQFDEPRERFALRVDSARRVRARVRAELLLDDFARITHRFLCPSSIAPAARALAARRAAARR